MKPIYIYETTLYIYIHTGFRRYLKKMELSFRTQQWDISRIYPSVLSPWTLFTCIFIGSFPTVLRTFRDIPMRCILWT